MTIPQQAIEEAVHQYAAHVHGDVDFEALTDDEQHAAQVATDDILTAALPALEQHIREQVAREIDEGLLAEPTRMHVIDWREGMENAARIAVGKQ